MRVCRLSSRWFFAALLTTGLVGAAGAPAFAQEKPAAEPAAQTEPEKASPAAPPEAEKTAPERTSPEKADAVPQGEAMAVFNAKLTKWKEIIKKLRSVDAAYQVADKADLPGLRQQWDGLIAEGNALVPELRAAGIAAYQAKPNSDRELTGFLVKLAEDEVKHDRYNKGLELAQLLIDNECDRPEIFKTAGIAAYSLNDFDAAEAFFKKAPPSEGGPPDDATRMQMSLAEDKKNWEHELEIREAEAKADDLPRVKLTTTQGDIVLELFENEAPQTVGNFISLVESDFYNNVLFHRVLANFMAQTGDPEGDGTGGPGYQIPCECYRDDARLHFRGSVSMAHAGLDTGGSQFFLTFRPTPQLNPSVINGQPKGHTVFGRVIEGMDVLAELQRQTPGASKKGEPDKIISAEVLRKRNHEYKPTKVE